MSIVLSLCDGISCGQVALKRLNIPFEKYYASEIDKHAIKVTQHNHPNTIQLGNLENWQEWDIEWDKISLILSGTPCQDLSIAGNRSGLNGEKSKLFFSFLDVLKFVKSKNPKVKFLFENVASMASQDKDRITECLEVYPVKINSALVSAQNRNRYYWSNLEELRQPLDKGILLNHILESGVCDRDKSYCIDANYYKGGNLKSYFEKGRRQLVFEANNGKKVTIKPDEIFEPKSFYESRTELGKKQRRDAGRLTGKDTTPRNKHSRHYIVQKHEKANCLVTVDSFLNYVIDKDYYVRKLTPVECERLQALPDEYTSTISKTQRYKALGNAWTVDVIAHLLKDYEPNSKPYYPPMEVKLFDNYV